MEVKEEKAMDPGGERKIPVFTVLKNGSILKNIFVVNSSNSLSPDGTGNGDDDHEVEEILVVGRHPDCNIMLTHPSVSRFHLQIRSIPSRQQLSVTDLSSVHGTWVLDQKIEAGTSVEVKEGDTIRIGGSTRIYRLHWIPLSRAYDMDNPFVSPLDIYATNELEEENRVLNAENVEVTRDDGKFVPGEGEIPQLDWTSDRSGSSIPSEDPVSTEKETSSFPHVSPSELSFAGYSLELQKQQVCGDVQASPNVITDNEDAEVDIPNQQNGGCPKAMCDSSFAELAEDAESGSIPPEDNGETEVFSRQVMEASASLFAETGPLLEIKAKDIGGLVSGWQPLLVTPSKLVDEADNQSLHQEDNGETEVVLKQNVAVSAQSFTVTETLLETKTKVNQGPLLGWQPLSEIQNEPDKLVDNQSHHQEDDGEIDVISTQVMAVSSCSFPETVPLLEIKTEDIQGLSLGWQPMSEIQSEQADNRNLHEEDDGEADDVSRQDLAASSCSFPETEPFLETKSLYIQDKFLGWQPLSHIQSEGKPARDKKLNLGMTGETAETFDEASNLSMSKGSECSELWSSSLGTNEIPKFEECESVVDISCGGGFREACSLSELESHQNNEKMGFIAATLAAEESANLSQPAQDIFSDVSEGKENQPLRSHSVKNVVSETENLRGFPLESAKSSRACNIPSRGGESTSVLQIRTKRSEGKAEMLSGNCTGHLRKKVVLHADSQEPEQVIFTPDKENLTPNTHILKRLQEIGDITESESSSLHAAPEKLESEIFTPDKENLSPNAQILERIQKIGDIKKRKSSSKAAHRPLLLIIPSINDIAALETVVEPEIYTPDKENLTPNSLMQKRLQEVDKLQGSKDSSKVTRKLFSSKVVISPDIHSSENIVPMEKENQSSFCSTSSQSGLKQEQMLPKRRTERVLFQPLIEKSSAVRCGNSRSSCPSILSNGKSKMKWTIVVDTSSLLDRESNKSLQLLQGLKRTQLIISRTVLRELDELKRCRSLFFRKTTEVVSSALEWIRECMVKTEWWVHIQSSSEEIGPTKPTPPTSPSLFGDGSAEFPSSLHQAAPEIVSPTSEDNVLDCALLYRKRNIDGQLVILSNDASLKIKAMAEGVICETAKEFYESIVNPFSKRFMWAGRMPRGQNGCYLDDVVRRERYDTRSFPFRKKASSKGGESSAKGLKLILRHNYYSHCYGHNW